MVVFFCKFRAPSGSLVPVSMNIDMGKGIVTVKALYKSTAEEVQHVYYRNEQGISGLQFSVKQVLYYIKRRDSLSVRLYGTTTAFEFVFNSSNDKAGVVATFRGLGISSMREKREAEMQSGALMRTCKPLSFADGLSTSSQYESQDISPTADARMDVKASSGLIHPYQLIADPSVFGGIIKEGSTNNPINLRSHYEQSMGDSVDSINESCKDSEQAIACRLTYASKLYQGFLVFFSTRLVYYSKFSGAVCSGTTNRFRSGNGGATRTGIQHRTGDSRQFKEERQLGDEIFSVQYKIINNVLNITSALSGNNKERVLQLIFLLSNGKFFSCTFKSAKELSHCLKLLNKYSGIKDPIKVPDEAQKYDRMRISNEEENYGEQRIVEGDDNNRLEEWQMKDNAGYKSYMNRQDHYDEVKISGEGCEYRDNSEIANNAGVFERLVNTNEMKLLEDNCTSDESRDTMGVNVDGGYYSQNRYNDPRHSPDSEMQSIYNKYPFGLEVNGENNTQTETDRRESKTTEEPESYFSEVPANNYKGISIGREDRKPLNIEIQGDQVLINISSDGDNGNSALTPVIMNKSEDVDIKSSTSMKNKIEQLGSEWQQIEMELVTESNVGDCDKNPGEVGSEYTSGVVMNVTPDEKCIGAKVEETNENDVNINLVESLEGPVAFSATTSPNVVDCNNTDTRADDNEDNNKTDEIIVDPHVSGVRDNLTSPVNIGGLNSSLSSSKEPDLSLSLDKIKDIDINGALLSPEREELYNLKANEKTANLDNMDSVQLDGNEELYKLSWGLEPELFNELEKQHMCPSGEDLKPLVKLLEEYTGNKSVAIYVRDEKAEAVKDKEHMVELEEIKRCISVSLFGLEIVNNEKSGPGTIRIPKSRLMFVLPGIWLKSVKDSISRYKPSMKESSFVTLVIDMGGEKRVILISFSIKTYATKFINIINAYSIDGRSISTK